MAYANLGKLQIAALLPFILAHKTADNRKDQTHAGIFTAWQEDGEWLVRFLDDALQRRYELNQPADCQGAFAIPPLNDEVRQELASIQNAVERRALGMRPDINVAHVVSSTQMLTLLTVALGERGDYMLSRHTHQVN